VSDIADTEEPVVAIESDSKKPKKAKAKKRPSDFEIVRTILQRTSERKQAFLLKNLGEADDILFLCSVDEKGFTYGSPELSIAMIQITDPDLKTMVDGYLGKIYGLQEGSNFSGFVGLRDQISELSKTKGETMECEVYTNDAGTAWVFKSDVNGERPKPAYLALAIESLFHVQLVESYSKSYRPLLDGEDAQYLTYPYTHTNTDTASILAIPPSDKHNHPMTSLYPNGLRAMVTKGLDVIITKGMTGDFPYPITDEQMILFHDKGAACHLVHRVVADGWRMLVTRPNAVYFPTPDTPLDLTGTHQL
jgi:hypothetical protein